jgi:hypothetical protein
MKDADFGTMPHKADAMLRKMDCRNKGVLMTSHASCTQLSISWVQLHYVGIAVNDENQG